jgi:hypothetical protein
MPAKKMLLKQFKGKKGIKISVGYFFRPVFIFSPTFNTNALKTIHFQTFLQKVKT